MPTAFSYIRFSSAKQAHGDSLKRQADMVGKWLVRHPDYVLSNLSFQDLGKSGFSGAHLENAFGRLLAAIESGDIPSGSTILIEAIDRAGRLEPMEMLPMLSRIVNAGVEIVTLDDGITYNRESVNSNHLFLLVAKVQQAYQYSDALSRRIKAAYASKREKAAAGEPTRRRTPLWITPEGKLREDIAPLVAQVFEDYACGIGERRILRRLRDQHTAFETTSPSTFRRWLRNPIAIGNWNDIPDVYPPVVSKELWYRVQKKLDESGKPRSASSKYLLSGLVKCARCGKNYCVGNQKGPLVMLCVTRHRYGSGSSGCSNSRSIPYTVLDYIRSQTAHAALIRAAQSQNLTASEKRQIEIDGELAELRNQEENAVSLLVRYGEVTSITHELGKVLDQIKSLEQENALLKATPAPTSLSEMIDEEDMLLDDDPERLNALLQNVGYVLVCDDRTVTVEEASIFNDRERQEYRYQGSNRATGIYKLLQNGETLLELPNMDSHVQKAEYAAFLAEAATAVTLHLRWNGTEFVEDDA